ncbi:MAG: hypothetical protein DRP15_02600 [Candidatus Aenigmatarchaeota archaeon]|nr:MAG: hypothetical protein DRP15_02600 [Candidatus Aenigmarchaeota archaeon]
MRRGRFFLGLLVLVGIIVILGGAPFGYGDPPPKPRGVPFRPTAPQPTPTPQPQPHLEIARVDIQYFRTTTGRSIALGEYETLRWRIECKNVRDIGVEITPDVGRVPPGTRTDLGNGRFLLEGTRRVRPARTTTYILHVTGRVEAFGRTKSIEDTESIRIIVRRPKLELRPPVVDQSNLKIKFIAANTGEADFLPGPIEVYYHIVGTAPVQTLLEDTFTSPRVGIKVGEEVELGEVTLPDRQRALSGDSINIIVEIGASYVFPLEGSGRRTFTHYWETKTLTINEFLVDTLAGLLVGSIRLNNYNGHEGTDIIFHKPIKKNDSYVEIGGTRMVFTPPVIEYHSGGYDYYGFLNDINATIGDRTLFSVVDGKIKVTLRFETGGGNEIRGWESTWGGWNDLTAPDVNFKQLEVAAFLTPALRNGRVTYSGVEVSPGVSMSFVGAYDTWLMESVRSNIENEVRNQIRDGLSSILMRDDIRHRIEDAIDEALHRLRHITRIKEVIGEGNEIRIVYLE